MDRSQNSIPAPNAAAEPQNLPFNQSDIGNRLSPDDLKFYEEATGKSGDVLVDHLCAIREQAWPCGQYPCIGSWLFLHFPWRKHEYSKILQASHEGVVLDMGCCFGQDLRRLVADGVPSTKMWATDLNPKLWSLGTDLFQDKERFSATFVDGDIFSDQIVKRLVDPLQGKVSVVLANQFFHLFDKIEVHEVLRRVVQMSRPGCIVVGYQAGVSEELERQLPWGKMWFQNVKSWKQLWQQIGLQTKTEWIHDYLENCEPMRIDREKGEFAWMDDVKYLQFVTRRLK